VEYGLMTLNMGVLKIRRLRRLKTATWTKWRTWKLEMTTKNHLWLFLMLKRA
jgi:hypothetical protein